VLEKAPREMRGGNTHWSGGVLRFAFDDPREIGPTDHQKGQGRAFYEKACAMSLEGIVSKRAEACRELRAMVETINADRAAQ